MAKNPVEGFTMAELERSTRRAEKKMKKNAAILPQIEGPGNPDFESKDPQGFAGDDTYTYKKEDDSPLNAYVSTAASTSKMLSDLTAGAKQAVAGLRGDEEKEDSLFKKFESKSDVLNKKVDLAGQVGEYDPSTNYSGTFEESKKRNPFYIGKEADKSKNYFNKYLQS